MQARFLLTLGLFAVLVGCQPQTGEPTPPITIQQWKELPAEKKYHADILDRVKDGDPSLHDDAAWERFMKTVVTPARPKDFPAGVKSEPKK